MEVKKMIRSFLCAAALLCSAVLTAAETIAPVPGPVPVPVPVPPPAQEEAYSISGLVLDGEIQGENITFKLAFQVEVKSGEVVIPLVVGDVSCLDEKLPSGAKLEKSGDRYLLRMSPGMTMFGMFSGKRAVTFKFASKPAKDGEWRKTSFSIPAASVRKLGVLCDRNDLEVKFPGGLDVKRQTVEGKTMVTAYLGGSGEFIVEWKPQIKKFESELVMSCDANTIATASVGALRCDTVFTYKVIQGSVSRLVLDVPEVNITQVLGEDIQNWSIDKTDKARPKLIVALSRPKEDVYRLRVESEVSLAKFPCKFDLPVITPQGVLRASGFLMAGTDSAIKLQISKAAGLTQVDQDAFPAAAEGLPGTARVVPQRSVYAYQYANMPYTLSVGADDVVSSFSADDTLVLKYEDNDLVLDAAVQIDVKDAPARELLIEVDTNQAWTVTSVTGRDVSEPDTDVREEKGARIVYIPFKQAVAGMALVNIRMERPLKADATNFAAPYFKVRDAKSERGHLMIAAEKGIRLKVADTAGLREFHAGMTPKQVEGAQQVFRFREPGWAINLTLERTVSALHSEVFHLVSLGEQVMYYSASITYHIAGAPVQEFKVKLPKGLEAVEFTGADIEGWTREGDVCKVRLQRKIMGDYTLLVTYDRPVPVQNAEIVVGDIETVGTDSELGYIALASSASIKLSEGKQLPQSVIVINRNELPSAYASLAMGPILKVYKCVRAPHQVAVKIEPYEKEQLLSQIADYVGLKTKISKDGELETTATYFVKNASRQHLVVTLPQGAMLWAIKSIDDNGTRQDITSQTDTKGRCLIPVRRPRDPNAWTRVEITYAQSMTRLGFWSTGLSALKLEAPKLPDTDAPFASWAIDVPANFTVSHVDGNMTSTMDRMFGGIGEAVALAWQIVSAPFRSGFSVLDVAGGLSGESHIELSRTVNMAGGEPLLVQLQVVPGWMGHGSSAAGFTAFLGLGVLVLLVGIVKRRSAFLQALGLTLCVVGASYSGTGRLILAWLLIGVTVLLVWRPVWRLVRRVFSRRKKPDAPAVADDEPPFEADLPEGASVSGNESKPAHDGREGSSSIKCLFLAAAVFGLVAAGVAGAAVQLQAPVMDVVNMSISAPGTGKDIEQSATVEVNLEFKVENPALFNLLPTPNVMTDFELGSKSLEIVGKRDGYYLNVKSSGKYKIKYRFQAPVLKKDGQWALNAPLPANLKNQVSIKLPEGGLELLSDTAVLFKPTEQKDATEAVAGFGPQNTASFVWKPRVRKTKLEQAVFFCEVNTYVALKSGVLDLMNIIKYQIAQGEIKELKVRIPDGVTVTAVKAGKLATWSFDPEKKILTAILERPVSGEFSLVLATQIAKEGLPYSAGIGALQIIDAARQRGAVELAAPESIQVKVDESKGLSAMNIEDFSRDAVAAATQDTGKAREVLVARKAFRYNQPEEVMLKVQTEKVLSEVRIAESGSLSIGDERIVLSTQLKFAIAKSGIFSATLEIPADFEVETLTGKDVSHWDEVKDAEKDKPRVVTVHFNRQILDGTEVNLVVARSEKGIEQKIPVPRVAVRDAGKHTGRLMVVGERGVRIMVDTHAGVDLKKASEEGVKQAGVLVFDILRPDWSILLKTEVMAPAVKPEILQVVDLAEGMLQCKAFIQYKIENAGIKSFRIKSPVPGVTLTFTGKNIARAVEIDKQKGLWQVDLQTKVEDGFSMLVNYQLPYDSSQLGVKILPLQAIDTEENRGYLVVTCSGGVQVEPKGALAGLKVDDPRNVPQAFGAGDLSGAIRCYRTTKSDYALDLSVVRHKTAAVLPASVGNVEMVSVMSSGGKLLTRVELKMNVGDLRFLKLALPNSDDKLWTVLVNGKEVTTSRDGKLYCIPLEDQQGDQQTTVDFVYAGSATSEALSFREKYQAPKLVGLPLKNIEWRFFALPGRDYYGFDGTLEHVPDSGEPVRVFNAGFYQDVNKNLAIGNLNTAKDRLKTGQELIQTGKPSAAKRVLEQAMSYSQSDRGLNEDARVQYRNLQKQQVKIGLVNRRDAVRFQQNIMDARQMEQMKGYQDGDYTQEYARNIEQRLSEKDNGALEQVADKIIDQQAAAAGVVSAINITLPEHGKLLVFRRDIQVDPSGDLTVGFKTTAGVITGTLVLVLEALAILLALWALLAFKLSKK